MRTIGRRVAGRPLALPRWWVAVLVAVVLLATGVVVAVVRTQVAPCRDELVASPRNPLLDEAGMRAQPDARLDTLAAAVDEMGAPFGDVRAGVGYDYDQWLHLYAVEDGLLAFTKNNAPVTLLDPDTLEPRWALRPDSARTAWDAFADRFLLLDLAAGEDTRVSAYDVDDGQRVWCVALDQEHTAGDPVSTTFLDNGDVVTALPDGDRIAVTRLSAGDGSELWGRSYDSLGGADYLGQLTDDLLLAGGAEEFRLAEQASDGAGGPVISALEVSDGTPAWSWSAADDAVAHVVGIDDRLVVVVERSPDGVRMLALSDSGEEVWSVEPEDAAHESTLRSGVVLVKSPAALYGYDAQTGDLLWEQAVPTDRTYFPYGFTLGQMPSLDDDHVLVPTTTDLVVLDVHDGSTELHPLPVDGVSTTYWPYQLLATPDLLGVVTNTGAVLARRE